LESFDYLFSFYGLLLGIAVANVAIGFADMWRDCERIRVGACPPLLAFVVLLGGMNVWLTTWQTRHDVTVGGWQMLAAAGIALPYVFVSRAMFPGQEKQPELSLEGHYLKHRLLILSVLVMPPVVSVLSKALLDDIHDYGWREGWITARIAAPLLLMPFRARPAQRAGLGGFVALELTGLFR
jgi:uncharacterized membrane protein